MPVSFKRRSRKRRTRSRGSKRKSKHSKPNLTLKKLSKKVKTIAKGLESLTADYTHRQILYGYHEADVNKGNIDNLIIGKRGDFLNVLDHFLYYDPNAPSALVEFDYLTGTFQKDVLVTKQHVDVRFRANYGTPARMQVWEVRLRKDSDVDAQTWIEQSADETIKNIADPEENPWVYPSDLPSAMAQWHYKPIWSGTIPAGGTKHFSANLKKPYTVNLSEVNQHNTQFSLILKPFGIMFRTFGEVSRDLTDTALMGRGKSAIECECVRTWRFQYDGGADIEYTYIVDGKVTMTNGDRVEKIRVPSTGTYNLS